MKKRTGLMVVLCMAAMLPIYTEAASVQAQKAHSVIDVMGVAMHHDRDSYSGVFGELKAAYQELGIRYLRGAGVPNTANINAGKELYRDLGIRFVYRAVMKVGDNAGTKSNVDGMMAGMGTQAIIGFEGMNEYDNSGVSNWAEAVRASQEYLYNYVKSKGVNIKVVGPSLAHWDSGQIGALDSKGVGNFADVGSTHIYVAGNWTKSVESKLNAGLDSFKTLYDSKPIYNTEFGHCTAAQSVCMSEKAAAKRVLQYYATLYMRNPQHKAFIYEMTDRGTTPEWGIIRADNSRKPVFYAMRNFTRILKDDDPTYAPGALDYTLAGAEATTRQLLLQKKDGKFYLLLWRAVPVWNGSADVNNTRDEVTLSLAKNAMIRVFEPADPNNDITKGDQPLRTVTGTNVTLGIPDSMMIVEIANGGTTGTSGGTSGGATGGTTSGGTTTTGPCDLYGNTAAIPANYGVPWNIFTSVKEVYLTGLCNADGSVKYTVGSKGPNQYVYNTAYYYSASWKPFTLAGTFVQGSTAWLQGQGMYTQAAAPSANYFWVSYVCHWINSTWKCGCRDAACTTPYWQLQGVKR